MSQRRLRRDVGSVQLRPGINDRDDLCWLQVCEGEIVLGRKCHYVTSSSDRLGLEEQGRESCPYQRDI